MNKTSYKPRTCLAKYIDRIYVLKHSEKFELPVILPGTGLELLFHTNDAFSVNNQQCDQAHIICPRTTVIAIDKTNEVSFISVRFKSGAFRHFSTIPYIELNNQFVSVEDIWGAKARDVMNRLNDQEDDKDKIEIIENFLLTCLYDHHNKTDEKWDNVIHSLYKGYNVISLKEFASHTSLSYRQFERNFKTQFGITPKKFQRITRFQATIKKILMDKENEYLSTALANGYYDQSHFIHDFQLFTKMKPSEYFTKINFENHYYDKSIYAT